METQHAVAAPRPGVLIPTALISCVALLLAFAAFDDITTDSAAEFTVEYNALVACAAWFAFVAVRLIRIGDTTLGIVSLAALGGALWGQHGIAVGTTPGVSPEYLVVAAAFVWFSALTTCLLLRGSRRE